MTKTFFLISFITWLSVHLFAANQNNRPNILFIIADDLSPRAIGALGNSVIQTPTLDSLASHGTVFTNAYNQGATGGAICVSSRSMFMTGHFLSNSDNHANSSHPLWGEEMKNLGYDTYAAGKWHNGNTSLNKSFDHTNITGGCACEGYGAGAQTYSNYPNSPAYDRPGNPLHWEADDFSRGDGHWNTKGSGKHSSTFIADVAINYMNNFIKNDSDPFFMFLSFNAPHDFRQAPTQYIDMYSHQNIDFLPNYMETHPFNNGDTRLPNSSNNGLVRDEWLAPTVRDSATYRLHRSEYYAIISHMDAEIQRVLNALKSIGKSENTYVIFTADHGLAIGEHGLMGKQNMYEHSAKAPFFITGPTIKKEQTSDALIYIQSAFPTSLDFAGGSIPSHIQFQSVKPILEEERVDQHLSIYGRYKNVQRMIRTKYYKLIAYPNISKIQLFRLSTAGDSNSTLDEADPYEIRNLSDRSEYAQIVSGHLRELKNLMAGNGQVSFSPAIESRILPEAQSSLVLARDTITKQEKMTSSFIKNTLPNEFFKIKIYSTKGKYLGTLEHFSETPNWQKIKSKYNFHSGLYVFQYSKGNKVVFTKTQPLL